ncbi:pentatricopeptide repeat-containing protein At5g15280, mitochondrial [Cynara cardunculus var. scolymus]|nr:pentatricopeptide repeat-containing protein At5g15280, mitochondrial [Cynara cardunculus var. scolymus]
MLFSLQRSTHSIKVSHLFALFSLKQHCSSSPFQEPQIEPHKSNKSHIDTSSVYVSGFTKSVLDKCSALLVRRTEHSTSCASSLEECLLSVSHLNPRITRKFWRKSRLEPQDVLELLLGYESSAGKLGIDVQKVGSLLGIFKWASASTKQGRSFKHLDQSFKVMVGLLVQVGLFKDAECLLLAMDKEGILLDDHEVFSNLIEWYVGIDELEKSINMYHRMRALNLVPSLSCYRTLLNYLVHRNQTQLISSVYGDMLEMGLKMGVAEKDIYENVVKVLCRSVEKVQESRNLIKKAFLYGIKPTSLVLDAIASGYCEKQDYGDLLSLFVEIDCVPDVVVGNKIIHSICQNFGAEEAFVFLEELEHLGFSPDAITFGILIGWNCQEGNLRNAFVCLSIVLSRGLKPHRYSYNAIISGVFKQGMWNHAKEIVLEMEDEGITPDMSTFRVLLAGYCKARQFDEVKVIVEKMVHNGLIELSPLQDPISISFMLLGIDPLTVRVRRDNDVGFSKTEFYDSMGNGLYLEGDIVDYDQTMTSVLNNSMVPDCNRLIMKDDGLNISKTASELVHWGQELSFAAFSTLLKKFHASNSSFKTITTLLENMPKLHNELDEETLNLLVQMHVKRGFILKAKKIYDEMVKRNLKIKNKTYSVLVLGLCKKGNSRDLHDCWELPENQNWFPTLNDYRTLLCSLCQNDMLMEALFLFERAMLVYPHEVLELSYAFLEKICGIGFTKVACVLFDELLARGYDLDQVAYSHLLKGLCKEKRFSEAFVMSVKMLGKHSAPDLGVSGSLEVDIHNVLLHGYCLAKDLRKVKEVVGVILKKNITISISSYSKLVSLMCNDGRIPFALLIKDLMVEQSSSHLTLYNILIFHLFASRNSACVDILLDEIQDKGLEFDNVTYNFLVYGFSQCKAVPRSLQYLTAMMSKELKPSNRCLRSVISLLQSGGEFKKVLKLSREMEARGWIHCSTFQNEVVEGLLKINKLQEAVDFLDKMILKDLIPENINYDNLIKQMCRYGRKDKAFHLLDIMLKKGNTPNSTSYDCLIQDLCVSHKMEEALDLYTEMSNRKLIPSTKTHEVVTEKLCQLGRTSEAEKLIDAMISMGEHPSKVMFGSVVSRYRLERNFPKASKLLQRMQEFGYKPDFETHWSVISTLSRFSGKDKDDNSRNFLSRLLSESGFNPKSK